MLSAVQPFCFPEVVFDAASIADEGLDYAPGHAVIPLVVLIDCAPDAILLADGADLLFQCELFYVLLVA
jgi:hypothetical protein